MTSVYKHGTYGEFAPSSGGNATQTGTVAVYIGTAPVNLVRGWADAGVVNAPVLLTNLAAARRMIGYSKDWGSFTLSEAVKAHFDNVMGNAGPIIAINVLDPATHKAAAETTQALTFANGRATILSDTIILDTLVLADKVEGVDYAVDYDWTAGQVIITSIGDTKITGNINATYSVVDVTQIDQTSIIGGITAGGEYTGLGVVDLVYQETNRVPNLIVAPGWSTIPAVYEAMVKAGTNINGHWNAFVLADVPLSDTSAVDTIEKANAWAVDNGYISERSGIYWPKVLAADGTEYHLSTIAAWLSQTVDATHNGVPMESPSNKPIPIARLYFGENSTNRGFDQQRANDLNANGISTAVYYGGRWVLWGNHTAAYKFGAVADKRSNFATNVRMMMHILNSFHLDWAMSIDQPMTLALADTIRNREQEKADALVAVGALIGNPTVRFIESENSTAELSEGNFVWDFEGTPTPPFKSGTMRVGYTDAGYTSYFGEGE